MKEALAIDAVLIRGSDGIFDVAVDGEIIFSKHIAGRFPSDTEIIERLRKRI